MIGSRPPILAWWVAGLTISAAALAWYGYRANRDWQDASNQIVQRQADETASLLVTALTRDMRAVDASLLASSEWDDVTADSLLDGQSLIASAFARYPYPETFIAWNAHESPLSALFFSRVTRPPQWDTHAETPSRYPVRVHTHPLVATTILDAVASAAIDGRRLFVRNLIIAGVPYQVVARLRYQDVSKQHLRSVFGFMVNRPWVGEHYFPDLTRQVTRVGGAHTPPLQLAILDESRNVVYATSQASAGETLAQRSFLLAFFNPSLVAINADVVKPARQWQLLVSAAASPTLVTATRGANVTFVVGLLATLALAVGLFLTARTVRARADLADSRADFVASVTHNLKTPIATIQVIGDALASRRMMTGKGQRHYGELLSVQAKTLARLVENALAFARITDLADVYSLEPLDLKELLASALHRFSVQFAQTNTGVRINVPDDLPFVHADRTAMNLLLDNLIDNAIRYSEPKREVWFRATHSGNAVVFQVGDEGRGIPAHELNRVTEKFFRGSNASTAGNGLGLAIAQRIVADHGGTLTIESTIGVGTTITVAFMRLSPRGSEETYDGVHAAVPPLLSAPKSSGWS